MSSGFSYVPPKELVYMKALRVTLKKRGLQTILDCLQNAQCSFYVSNSFSRIRWDGLSTVITLSLPLVDYERLDLSDDDKRELVSICDFIMPREAGLDITDVEFSPDIESLSEANTLEEDLDKIRDRLKQSASRFVLPGDIIEKGREMAEAYVYLYAVENYIRLFIERVAEEEYGTACSSALNIPAAVKGLIANRKTQEAKNQWMSVRGGSDLFYMDFKELGIIIQNNWDLFKQYFPDQAWICSKISELGNCRNLIAHNSVIGDHEMDVIRVSFNSITEQLRHVCAHVPSRE